MTSKLHERLFMSDRAHMRDIQEGRELLEAIAKELRDNETLRTIDDERQKDAVYKNPKDEAFLKKIMGRLLKDDKEIEKLLGLQGGIIGSAIKKVQKQTKKGERDFQGRHNP